MFLAACNKGWAQAKRPRSVAFVKKESLLSTSFVAMDEFQTADLSIPLLYLEVFLDFERLSEVFFS